jgi:ketosteroid isomerase-like protein
VKAWIGLVLVALAVLWACVSNAEDYEATQAEIIRQDILNRAVMVNEGNVEGLIAAWCEDGIRMAPNKKPIVGIENLAKATRGSFSKWEFSDRVHDVQEVRVSGDMAFSWGYYWDNRTPKAGGDTRTYRGKYLVILLRQPDGSWKKYNDCTNDDPAP